jgi:hypothetical protein
VRVAVVADVDRVGWVGGEGGLGEGGRRGIDGCLLVISLSILGSAHPFRFERGFRGDDVQRMRDCLQATVMEYARIQIVKRARFWGMRIRDSGSA